MARDTIAGYTYRADVFCPVCVVAQLPADVLSPAAFSMPTEDVLNQVAAYMTVDRFDEYSFDSDEFPKVIFAVQLDDTELCGNCGEGL